MVMTQGTLNNLFDEVVTSVAYDAAFQGPAVSALLYYMRAATGRRERVASFSDLGEFETKLETAAAAEDAVVQQFEKTFVPVALAKSVPFSREMAEDEEFGFVSRLAVNIGSAFNQTIESRASALFNDAFTGVTYLAEDGKSICNSAHLNGAGGNSQGNSGTNTLNMAGVKASMIAQKKLLDYRGVKNAKVKADTLLVPVDLLEAAWEIARSYGRPDNANNALNMYGGLFDVIEWDELSDTNAWFMLDRRRAMMNQDLLWLWRTPFEMFGDGDLFTGVRKIGAYFRATHGCVDWRWIYGNNPS